MHRSSSSAIWMPLMLPLLLAEVTFPPAEVDVPSVIVCRFILISVTGTLLDPREIMHRWNNFELWKSKNMVRRPSSESDRRSMASAASTYRNGIAHLGAVGQRIEPVL